MAKVDERILGQVLNLNASIDYQDGSVVSQTLMGKVTGNVTLFAFGKGEGLSEHTAPFDAMVHVVEGEVEIKISGHSHHLKVGDAIVMPADKPHALKAITDFKMLLIMIKSR